MTILSAGALLHGQGLDEALILIGAPLLLFLGVRYLAWRREMRDAGSSESGEPEDTPTASR